MWNELQEGKWELAINWSGYNSVHRLLDLTNTLYFTTQVLLCSHGANEGIRKAVLWDTQQGQTPPHRGSGHPQPESPPAVPVPLLQCPGVPALMGRSGQTAPQNFPPHPLLQHVPERLPALHHALHYTVETTPFPRLFLPKVRQLQWYQTALSLWIVQRRVKSHPFRWK